VRTTTPPDEAAPAGRPNGRLRLTPEGVVWLGVALLLGAVGWWKSLNLVLLVAYLMATLLFLNGLLAWAQVRRVTAGRGLVLPVFAGEDAVSRVTVRNSGTWPATVGVVDRAGEAVGSWLLYRVPAGGEVVCSARWSFTCRGRYRGPPLLVWSGFPFGFARYELLADAGADVVVLPAVGTADPDGLRRWVDRQAGGGGRSRKVLRRVTADQADVRGVRPYRPGDSIRWIHWRSSARRGELMVREYDAAPTPELVLVVEPWLPSAPADADRANLEAALSLAATVVVTWSRAFGTRVTVAVAGSPDRPDREADSGPAVRTGAATEALARDALVSLADAVGGPEFAPLGPAAFGRPLGQAARLLVSSRPRSPLAAALARTTGRPFIPLDTASWLPWYTPPVGAAQRSPGLSGAGHAR
jgi:uncharacterized protein (DUF58 family)